MKKKIYEKPRVSKVALKPSEAVITACKHGGQSGPSNRNCKAGAIDCLVRRNT